MQLNELRPNPGSRKRKKRVGRGEGSGFGKTSGRGHKGQNSRAGGMHKVGFEGGQMPLQRRLPKRGFRNIFRKVFAVVNVDQLASWPEGTPVTIEALREAGFVRKSDNLVKLLGRGECANKLSIQLSHVSASARQKVEAAGGQIQAVDAN